jgi:gamma-glutamylcyclotransferase (GGCT)/AIG2-like uncharacterized protein YtfP
MIHVKAIPVFVYETLKKRGIQKQALGHTKLAHPTVLKGWKELDKESWPTIRKGDGEVPGEILYVTARELKQLDDWEDRYTRQIVHTEKGAAWAYIHK